MIYSSIEINSCRYNFEKKHLYKKRKKNDKTIIQIEKQVLDLDQKKREGGTIIKLE
jgi:hypothetical protein